MNEREVKIFTSPSESRKEALLTTCTEAVSFEPPLRVFENTTFGWLFSYAERESNAPARVTWGFERRSHVGLRQTSRGRQHLVKSERSEGLYLVIRYRILYAE